MIKVKVSHIPDDGELQEKGLSLGLDEIGLGEPYLGPAIGLSYRLQKIHGKILGNFEVSGTMGLECSRCLLHFEAPAKAKFLVEFEKEPESADPRNGIDPEAPELNVVFFSGDQIEFGEEIRQEMEVLVPFAPLCKEGCKGLCGICGANRNEADCGCESGQKNNPFQGLNQLFQQNKEN